MGDPVTETEWEQWRRRRAERRRAEQVPVTEADWEEWLRRNPRYRPYGQGKPEG
jgi:hypothetical protein